MEMIPRDNYLDWIDEFRDKPLVKVLTGLRRSGKSTILDMFMSRLEHDGVTASRIIKINFELLENEPYLDYRKLYDYIVNSKADEGASAAEKAALRFFKVVVEVAGRLAPPRRTRESASLLPPSATNTRILFIRN